MADWRFSNKEMYTFFAVHNNLAWMFGQLRVDEVSRQFHRRWAEEGQRRQKRSKKKEKEMASRAELDEVQELIVAAFNFRRVFGEE